MLYLIGLGLGDIKDITVKGLEIVKQCDKVKCMTITDINCCYQSTFFIFSIPSNQTVL